MARRITWVLAALLLTVSCSGGDQKGAPPPPSVAAPTAPTTPPTPAATPFVSPADQEGAFAFVRAYFEQLNSASLTGDVGRLAPYRSPTCSCVRAETNIEAVYSRGSRFETSDVRILDLALGQSGPAFAKVTAQFAASSDVIRNSDGTRTEQSGGKGRYFLSLVRVDDHWQIDDLLVQFDQ